MSHPTCIVDGCEKPSRSSAETYCKMHYHRMYRNGTLEARPWHKRTTCAVAGCDKPEKSLTYCDMHAARYQRNGTTEYVGVKPRYGEDNPVWIGDDAGYHTVHSRLAAQFGRAAERSCTNCGDQAKHWSYDHDDPDEKTSDYGAYSTDLSRYSARCVPCHKRFDLDRIDATRGDVLYASLRA